MKISIRIPSLKKRVAALTSVKRVVRHRIGVIVCGLLFVVVGFTS